MNASRTTAESAPFSVMPGGRSAWRRRAPIFLIAGSPLLLLIGGCLYGDYRSRARVGALIAAIERTDPDWRMSDLDKGRSIPPDGENSAPIVLRVASMVPNSWPTSGSPIEDPDGKRLALVNQALELPPQVRLTDEMAAALRVEMEGFGPTLEEARGIKDFPRGGTHIKWDPIPFMTLIPHIQQTRKAAHLLRADAIERAQSGDADGAIESVHAMINTARSIGDEPLLISMLVRTSIDSLANLTLERVLAQSEPSGEKLAALQGALAQEEAEPLTYIALRGERAEYYEMLEKLRTREVPMSSLGAMGMPVPMAFKFAPGWMFRNSQILGLEYLNDSVEAAKGPPELIFERGRTIDDRLKQTPRWKAPLAFLFLPATNSAALANVRVRTQLRCMMVMLAAERYRRDHGEWPKGIADLVPEYLADVPGDPFLADSSRGPIRFMRRADGLTVYSVSVDGRDDGGHQIDAAKAWNQPGGDLGYRLWDAMSRRQDAPARKAGTRSDAEGPDSGAPLETSGADK
jgi:hypothetical protein